MNLSAIRCLRVFVPAHNVGDSLEGLFDDLSNLEALLQGRGIVLSVLVCDDCSTDETPRLLEKFGVRYLWLSWVRQEECVGSTRNMLTGYYECLWRARDALESTLIACVDTDGEHNPFDIFSCIESIGNDGVAGVVGCAMRSNYSPAIRDRRIAPFASTHQAEPIGVGLAMYAPSFQVYYACLVHMVIHGGRFAEFVRFRVEECCGDSFKTEEESIAQLSSWGFSVIMQTLIRSVGGILHVQCLGHRSVSLSDRVVDETVVQSIKPHQLHQDLEGYLGALELSLH